MLCGLKERYRTRRAGRGSGRAQHVERGLGAGPPEVKPSPALSQLQADWVATSLEFRVICQKGVTVLATSKSALRFKWVEIREVLRIRPGTRALFKYLLSK